MTWLFYQHQIWTEHYIHLFILNTHVLWSAVQHSHIFAFTHDFIPKGLLVSLRLFSRSMTSSQVTAASLNIKIQLVWNFLYSFTWRWRLVQRGRRHRIPAPAYRSVSHLIADYAGLNKQHFWYIGKLLHIICAHRLVLTDIDANGDLSGDDHSIGSNERAANNLPHDENSMDSDRGGALNLVSRLDRKANIKIIFIFFKYWLKKAAERRLYILSIIYSCYNWRFFPGVV